MNLHLLEKMKGESAREYIDRVLRSNILNLNLKPGQDISEKEIADELHVSRTPVREAFIRLSQDELLEVFPQKGTSVTLINMGLVEEGRFVRETLEKAVVKLACENYWSEKLIQDLEENLNMQEFSVSVKNYDKLMFLDEQFHRIIFKACNKERTCSLIENLNSDFYRIRMLRLTSSIQLDRILLQHKELVNAIKERNSHIAEKSMGIHLTDVQSDQEIVRNEFPQYFKMIKGY